MKGTLMADMKGTLDFKFTIFSLLYTLWVRPTNPHPLHGAPARHHTRLNLPSTRCQPSQHTLGSRALKIRLWYLRQGTEISPKPCARSARLCRPFCRVALSLHRFSALPNRPPSIPPSQPCVAIVHQAGHSPRSPRAARSLTPTSARLSRPLGINFTNTIDSAIMTRFLNLSHALTINTGLNGIMA